MRSLASLAMATVMVASAVGAAQGPTETGDAHVKAAFLYNFAKFTAWPALPPRATILACVAGDDPLANALGGIVRGKDISGHGLSVVQLGAPVGWADCHLLFIAGSQVPTSAEPLDGIRQLPVLTVSDSAGFAKSSGLVELFIDSGRMRFAINVDAVERSGLHLSSRLLGLATVVRDRDVH